MPTMGTGIGNTAPPLNIQVNGVKKLLFGQNPHKASDPDKISPRFLKEMAYSIATALTLISGRMANCGTLSYFANIFWWEL